MINTRFGLYSFIFSLMLGIAPAWADVDISSMDKVEVGTWAELKAAVEDSQNAGKVIVLTGDIQADKNNPIDTIAGSGIIIDGGGFTITGQEGSSNGQFINFASSDTTDLIIQNVNIDGVGNMQSPPSSITIYGGAIYNDGTIGDINGDFSDNYADATFGSAYGGAIYNSETIGDITGDFSGNYAESGSYAKGGAIYNDGTIGDISGDFSDNSVRTGSSSPAFGGAIYNDGSSIIGNINGDFSGNYAQSYHNAEGGAIFNYGTIGDISGDFTSNYAQSTSTSKSARGGAIYNTSTIGNITGNFR